MLYIFCGVHLSAIYQYRLLVVILVCLLLSLMYRKPITKVTTDNYITNHHVNIFVHQFCVYWYNTQQEIFLLNKFFVTVGVKQGGILSASLLNVYEQSQLIIESFWLPVPLRKESV